MESQKRERLDARHDDSVTVAVGRGRRLRGLDAEHDAELRAAMALLLDVKRGVEQGISVSREIERMAASAVKRLGRVCDLDVRHDQIVDQMENVQARHLLGHRAINATLEQFQREEA